MAGGRARCITDTEAALIVEGVAPPPLIESSEIHAGSCDACRALLASIARIRAAATANGPTMQSGVLAATENRTGARPELAQTIGRYRVIEEVGRGGMGVVFSAEDELLCRTVAIKVLRPTLGVDRDGGRLLREARAMATVQHPNVVAVHDMGVHDGRVFVVMDLLPDGDLRGWISEKPRAWREIVGMWIAAGRGLQAIHDAKLVHRDFKPANVLFRADGRVQVSDFGLVSVPDSERALMSQVLGDSETTETGAVLGTLRYMAPEQLEGGTVGPAADQFAYCVSLWEALTQIHPFRGARRVPKSSDAYSIGAPPSGLGVPSAVFAALRKGLDRDPQRRFSNVGQLAAALEAARGAKRRGRGVAVAILGAVVAAGIWISSGVAQERPCVWEDEFDGVWDPPRREAVRVGMRRHGEPGAQWLRVEDRVETYTKDWSAARQEACRATRVRQTVPEAMLDRRTVCLELRYSALDAVLRVVEAGRYAAEVGAFELIEGLPRLARCEDLLALATITPRPRDPVVRQTIGKLERDMETANVLFAAGSIAEASTVADETWAVAEPLDWPPLTASILGLQASILNVTDRGAAVARWEQAYVAALGAGESVAYDTGVGGFSILVESGKLERASFLLDQLEAYAEKLQTPWRSEELPTFGAYLAIASGDLEKAEAFARKAVVASEQSEDKHLLPQSLGNLGGLLSSTGKIEESIPFTERAISILVERFGPEHPSVIGLRHNRARSLFFLGRYAEARAEVNINLGFLEGVALPLERAKSLHLLAGIELLEDNAEIALSLMNEVLQLREPILPPDHPDLAL
ncbi:MAG: protein kinase, partial [Nannocystaceae bacterium]|nr:protein kinase [Nannocystaceae bacterium]